VERAFRKGGVRGRLGRVRKKSLHDPVLSALREKKGGGSWGKSGETGGKQCAGTKIMGSGRSGKIQKTKEKTQKTGGGGSGSKKHEGKIKKGTKKRGRPGGKSVTIDGIGRKKKTLGGGATTLGDYFP